MRSRKRKGELAGIRDILEDVFTTDGFKRPFARICVRWSEVVGEAVSHHAAPTRLEREVLHVQVENSVWASELSFLKPDILRKLDEILGSGKVKDVVFRVVARSETRPV